MVRLRQIGFVLLVTLLLAGCNTRALREAERTLAMADSLKIEGIEYADSARLSQSVATLKPYRLLYPTAWAKANYYYGRMLRNKGYHVAAMECFIDASHTHCNDKILLGRIYTNMANMCRIKGEHSLAYEIYQTSATLFLQGGDSIMYYYALDNLAFELAAQKDTAALCLLDSIDAHCNNNGVRMKTLEMRSIAFECFQQYDSVLKYTEQLLTMGYAEATGYLIRARAFFYIEQPDSAVYYAKKVMKSSLNNIDKYNALYIITNCDTTLNTDNLLVLASNRADYGKAVEKEQASLAQAILILQQDRERKPNLIGTFIGLALALALVIVLVALLVIHRQRSKIQSIANAMQHLHTERQEVDQNKTIELEHICSTLKSLTDEKLKHELCWNNYEHMRSIVNARMFFLVEKLEQLHCLNEKEIRLCVLVLIDGSYKRLTNLLPYAMSGIGKYKQNTAQKLHTTTTELRNYLVKLCIESLHIAS